MIYLDNAATTEIDPRVRTAYTEAVARYWGNPSSPHSVGRTARSAMDTARSQVSTLTGYKPNEVIFTGSGSESISLAVRGLCENHDEPGHLITQETEHKAVLETCEWLRKKGWSVTVLPVDLSGRINVEELKKEIREDTRLVSIQWANNETGALQPVEEIALVCAERKITYHCDALQCVGIVPWPEILPDMMSLAAHKFYGPKGIGALLCKETVELSAMTRGGGQEHDLRSGTENPAAAIGFAQALSYAMNEQEKAFEHLSDLRAMFTESAQRIGATVLQGDAERLPNIVSLRFAGHDGETLVMKADMERVCISTGSACTTGSHEPSHVLKAMGKSAQEARETVRISFSKFTTEDEVRKCVSILKQITQRQD